MKNEYLLILIAASACNYASHESSISISVKEISNIPDSAFMISRYSQKFVCIDSIRKNKPIVISYFNGTCSACFENLFLWEDFVNNLNANRIKDVAVLLFFYTYNVHITKDLYTRNQCAFPIYFDKDCALQKYFDIEESFNTYIIDKNGKVIFKCNPVYEKDLWGKMISILSTSFCSFNRIFGCNFYFYSINLFVTEMTNQSFNLSQIIFICISLFSCNSPQSMGREQEGKAQTTPTPVEVTTAIALRETFELELPCNGQVEAARTARVCFETQGIISGVHVANGQVVKAGDLLASLDDAEPQLALQRAKLQLERAALEKKNLLLGYSPAQDTSKLSKEIVQTVEIRSGYTEAQLAVREAELKLSKTRLVAPVAGRVVDLKAKAHNPTSSYDFLCNIIDESSLQVAFNVLESELDMAAVGANVVVTPLTQAGHKSLGRITEVNRKVDNNGLISVVASLNEPNNALIPGMNVRVMVTSQLPNRLVIPWRG
jgi:RND family efflux transporter MFP subunit